MTLRIGFIGTGGIASNHLGNLAKMEAVSVVAFCDIQLERAEKAAAQWTNAKAYTNVDTMLDNSKLDAVYICVPPMAHGEVEEKVIARHIPFLVEKPIGIDREVPGELLKKVRSSKLITSVGYHWRYHDTTARALEFIKGSIPGMALGYWMGGMPRVPWWRLQSGSGGQLVEQTTHIVDLLRYTCGEIDEVYAAYGHRVMHEKVEGTDVPDIGTVTMKLRNGMVATISNTCLLPVGFKNGLDIYTDKGVVEISGSMFRLTDKEHIVEYKSVTNAFLTEDEAFVYAVRTGDASRILSDYEDAWKTHVVTIAATESAQTGAAIKLI